MYYFIQLYWELNICYATGKFYATEHDVVVTQQGYYSERFLYYSTEGGKPQPI